MIILVNGMESLGGFSYYGNCESEWTAFDVVELGQLEERELHEVLSRQQFQFRRAGKHRAPGGSAGRSLMKSISEEMPYLTGLTVTRSPAWNARRTRVATESRSNFESNNSSAASRTS